MSLPGLLARILSNGSENVSPRRRAWVRAAIAELSALPEGLTGLGWAAGIAALILRDLSWQALAPWRRDPGRRPPSLFIATASLLLLALPLSAIAGAAIETGPGSAPAILGPWWSLASFAAAGLAIWVNVGALFKAMPLGGLMYVLGIRLLPMNLFALALGAGLVAILAPAIPALIP